MSNPPYHQDARAAVRVAALSRWVDEAPVNVAKDPEAVTWHRVCKVAEEAGEAVKEMVGLSGGNPRKGVSSTNEAVIEECLDAAVAALGAVEHLTGNRGYSVNLLFGKIEKVYSRAGLAV